MTYNRYPGFVDSFGNVHTYGAVEPKWVYDDEPSAFDPKALAAYEADPIQVTINGRTLTLFVREEDYEVEVDEDEDGFGSTSGYFNSQDDIRDMIYDKISDQTYDCLEWIYGNWYSIILRIPEEESACDEDLEMGIDNFISDLSNVGIIAEK